MENMSDLNHSLNIPIRINHLSEIEPSDEITNVPDQPAFKSPESRINARKMRSSTLSSGSKSPLRRHGRNLSGTSSSSVSTTNTYNPRKGINIGISVVNSDGHTGKARNVNNDSQTNETGHNITSFNDSGISTLDGRNEGGVSLKEGDDVESLAEDKISETFKLLASKELEILEIKNQLKDLMNIKREKELELQYLKRDIERQLVNKNRNFNNPINHGANNIPKSPTSAQKQRMKTMNSNIDPLADDSYIPNQSHYEDNKRNSWFAKPLNFIQNFDNLIYKEFEKLQIPEYTETNNKNGSMKYPEVLIENEEDDDLIDMNYEDKNHQNLETSMSTDVIQSVSQHLWSFVNDVKSNLMTEESGGGDEPAVLAQSSPQKTRTRTRTRTASISNRKSYSQHLKHGNNLNNVLHKKRASMNISNDGLSDTINDTNDLEITKDQKDSIVQDLSKNSLSSSESKAATELISGGGVVVDESDLWDNDDADELNI